MCVCARACVDFLKDCLSIQCHTYVDLLVKEEIRMSNKLVLVPLHARSVVCRALSLPLS